MSWQIQEAKHRFSEMLRRAETEGPQTITRHGEPAAILISKDDYAKLAGRRTGLKEFLLSSPSLEDLELDRLSDLPREIDF
ncbi:MAG: type II toxin-antitoxin system Phd/YefM family antitoxin [Chloroflexota bacterium]